jgi:hypothetical protein
MGILTVLAIAAFAVAAIALIARYVPGVIPPVVATASASQAEQAPLLAVLRSGTGSASTSPPRARDMFRDLPACRGVIDLLLAIDCHTFDGQLFLLCPNA